MGVGGSCKRNKEPPIEVPDLKPIDAGLAASYEPNEIREIKVTDDFTILVSAVDGKFYGYGSKCPHYGAPFVKGVLIDGTIRCPWHGACFSIKTGDIEDHPGLDCIPTYQVIQSENGKLTVYPSDYGEYKVQRPLSQYKNKNERCLIIGGGAAALVFAQTLRENNFEGRILMISKDSNLPYDRTKLSKSPGVTWEDIKLKDEKWYSTAQIDIMLNACVEEVDCKRHCLFVRDDPNPMFYDYLLIATGCKPRLPTPSTSGVEGTHLKNVLVLHSLRDATRIKEKCAGKRVVIMGSGFIAMELAAVLPSLCKSIVIIGRSKRPYGVVLGETVGRIVQQHVIAKPNVKFRGGDEVKTIIPNGDGEVCEVITLKKKVYRCSVLIYAIGGVPRTEMFDEKGDEPDLNVLDSGFIPVTEYMQTNIANIYAAGDCVRLPLHCSVTKWAAVGHWGIAQKMGRIAAMNVLGIRESIQNTIPFFWHNVAGLSLRYTGYGEHYDESVIFGSLDAKKFCVLYRRGGRILACCTCNCDPIAARMTFDLQDEIEWENYPPYITEIFPSPPIIGETTEGLKYTIEDRLIEWDTNQQLRGKESKWVERRQKKFGENAYVDKSIPVNPALPQKPKLTLIQAGAKRDSINLATTIFNYPQRRLFIRTHFPPTRYRMREAPDIDRRRQ